MLSNMMLLIVICAEIVTLVYLFDCVTEQFGWKVAVVGVELVRPHGQQIVLPSEGLTFTISLDGWVLSVRAGRVPVRTQTVGVRYG